ncbi:RNA-directed DNA polymerase, eukaryota [Tanacetum coccineum]
MNALSINIQGLGHKTKKEWIKTLTNSFKLNFLAIQETKMTSISHMDVKFLWGNSNYDYVCSESLGNSGGILCIWEASIFKKINTTVSDNFIAIYGTWLPTNSKILFIAIYAPQQTSCKRKLWDYISNIVGRWNGESIIMGDFNEVRSSEERRGSCFNPYSARYFDRFISNAGLVDVTLEGYAFTWAHPSASKMSKLDVISSLDAKKLEISGSKNEMISELGAIDKDMDRGVFDDDTVFRRFELKHKLLNVSEMESKDNFQKSKVKWAVEGDENSNSLHGHINKRRAQLAIRGIFVDGFWETEPDVAQSMEDLERRCVARMNSEGLWSDLWRAVVSFSLTALFLKDNFISVAIRGAIRDSENAKEYLSSVEEQFKGTSKAHASTLILKMLTTKYDGVSGVREHIMMMSDMANKLKGMDMEISDMTTLEFTSEISHIKVRLFKGIQLPGSLSLSHLFYADDAMFIREWSNENLSGIINILKSFFLASGLQINILKSQLLGMCVPHQVVEQAASLIGCSIMSNKFRYLGVMVGEYSSRIKAWDDVILKLRSRLSKWKVKTLSIGGRLTLLKSVLGASPIYNMSIFKVPTGVLKVMESIRSRFFNGADQSEKKVTWVAWNKVLASKKHGGLGVSSFFALNRALLLKWVWRFVSQDGSLWYKVIRALYGSSVETHSTSLSSNWCSIMREVNKLKGKGFDFWSHCKKRIGNGDDSRFWFDCWIGDVPLRVKFPRLFALDLNKEASVAVKLSAPIDISFRRNARGGIEEHLLADLTSLMDSVTLSNSGDRWVCDLVSDGNFRVKEIRNYIDDLFLPHQAAQTRWIKYIPIKVNIFAWRARQDCLPTRVNLIRRGITIESSLCPVCSVCEEDVCHIFFRCDLAQLVLRPICRWWGLDPHDWSSFQEWQSWILSIQFSSKTFVRAKELFVWSPSFKGVNDAEFVSDDDFVNGEEEKNDDMSKKVNLEDESYIEGISETVFGDQDDPLVQELNQNSLPNEKEIFSDPFNLYNLINKRDKGEENTGLDSSLPFPPGFTPADQVKSDRKNSPLHSHSGGLNSRVLEESQPTKDQGSPKDNLNQRVGGSILEVIDDMIKVGQAMGFTMEGSKKDMEKIIGSQGVCDDIHIIRILYALYGSWVSKKGELIMISIYAPQYLHSKHVMVRFKKKLQILKKKIRLWVNDYRKKQSGHLEELRSNLRDIDKELDQGGVMVDGDWVDDPCRVKEEFRLHFANRFRAPVDTRYKLNYTFPNKLQPDQMATLESPVSRDEVRNAVWGCGRCGLYQASWSPSNLSGITNILHCFSLLSGLSINLKKSNLLGVGVRSEYVKDAAVNLAPKYVLHSMESLRRNFFNGSQCNERKIAWIKWTTTLASKKNGGLGISSLYALNRALLFKWVWRFISRDNSLWCRLILSMHGSKLPSSSPFRYSTWLSIIQEIHSLKDRGVDLVSHCRIHVGNGLRTNFWKEVDRR